VEPTLSLCPTRYAGSALRPWRAFVLAACAGLASSSGASEPVRFHDVKGWRGTVVASAQPTAEALGLIRSTLGAKGVATTLDYRITYIADFVLDTYDSEPSVWKGKATSTSFETSYRFTAKWSGGSQEAVFSGAGPLQSSGAGAAELQFHRDKGWSVKLPTGRITVPYREQWTSPEGKTFRNARDGTAHNNLHATKIHPYPARGYVLFATGESDHSFGGASGAWSASPAVKWEYTIYLEPTSFEELKLELEETEAYRQWRPDAKLDGGAGTPLELEAKLVTASGGRPKVAVESFVWELKDTSTVDGIAMNFPAVSDSVEYDLEFEATGPLAVLSSSNQRLTRAIRDGFTDTARVVPRDWGAWSVLHVTAMLADGRQVRGKLKGQKEHGVRLPKRKPDSKIADVWKAKNVTGADTLDDEGDPVGDGNKGDGFTLYEEYRGFVVDGRHVDGDPKAKDFFIYNLIGADAEPGIALFESLSGFRVHARLRENEFRLADRVMNANHTDAHVVDQHGVVINVAESAAQLAGGPADTFGAMTYSIDGYPKGRGFRPAAVRIVGLLPRGHAESLFSSPGNLGASDAIFTFDRAIAHELMHTVGVEEHGSGDGQASFHFVAPEDANNTVGRPYFALAGALGKPVELRNEQGHDVAASVYPRFMAEVNRWKNGFRLAYVGTPGAAGYPRLTEEVFTRLACAYVRDGFMLEGTVGAERGEHSGHQDCIMRYHFARFYPFTGRRDAFYLIAPGAERIGLELCRSAAGTGVNGPNWSPQSRHGSATAGNCAAQICPNDAVPPRPAGVRPAP